MKEYAGELAELRTSQPSLASRIGGFRTLEHILDWMKEDGLQLSSLDMVAQDEYCHDLLIPLEDDWLVFGMT